MTNIELYCLSALEIAGTAVACMFAICVIVLLIKAIKGDFDEYMKEKKK